jgi:hypothetical protein
MGKEPRNYQKLEELIKSSMSGMRPAYDPTSWDRLSARLDAEPQSAEDFDAAIHQRIRRVRPAYDAGSWNRLAARMELEYRRLQTVLHCKTLELSLAVLLLALAWPITSPTSPAQEKNLIPRAANPAPQAQADHRSPLVSDSESTLTGPLAAEISAPGIPVNGQTPGRLPAEMDLPETRPPARSILTSEAWSLPAKATAPPIAKAPRQLPQHSDKYQPPPAPSDDWLLGSPVASLDPLGLGRLDYGRVEDLLSYIQPIVRKTFIRIGFVGATDYNRVVTPPFAAGPDTTRAQHRFSPGYSGGFTVGVESGKWEVETGAVYAVRQYRPLQVLYVSGNVRDGYYGAGFGDFEINTLDLPLNFRYNFFLRDKWRLYGLVGGSLNLIMQGNYYTVSESAFLPNTALSQANEGNPHNNSPSVPEALESLSYDKGWFEGGSFWNNVTFYTNLGMGIERYMSPRWTLYAQPTYQHSLLNLNQGVGPYNDVIHNFSFRMGVKVRL